MTIDQLNRLNETKAFEAFEQCCGASRWVDRMVVGRPYEDLNELLEISDRVWEECDVEDYHEAFAAHARCIDTLDRSTIGPEVLDRFAEAEGRYEEKFGHGFILCSPGKPPVEQLRALETRLQNDPERELSIAAEEQNKITRQRLKKLLHTNSDTLADR